MGAPEAYVEKYLKKQLNDSGYICWKLQSPGTNGVPDRLIAGNGKVAFVECKRPGGKPTALQVKRLEELRGAGQLACVIDTRDKVDEFLQYLNDEIDIPEWYENIVKPKKQKRSQKEEVEGAF